MNDWERQHRLAQQYKEAYPPGTRLMLLSMNDPYHPVERGTRGTVRVVDDMGTIHMNWDNGRTLGIVPGEDEIRRLTLIRNCKNGCRSSLCRNRPCRE